VPELEALTAGFSYPIWTAVVAAVALVVLVVVVRLIGVAGMAKLTGSMIVLAAVLAAGWLLTDRAAQFERASERRALDQRSVSLTAQAVAPGSALACLDAMAGETIEMACEQAVFAGPSAVAAAISYTAARLAFLADAVDYAKRADRDYESVLTPIRTAMESDRFGIVAHVLSLRDSCTELQCDAFALLRDSSRVQANLKERTFESFVGRHSADWPGKGASPSADSGGSVPVTAATPLSPRYDFPSAASIPPVSIMNPEPAQAPAPPAASARPAAASAPPVPPRRPPPPRAASPRQSQGAPVQIAPPIAAGETDAPSLR
jgi:hypothetical protein